MPVLWEVAQSRAPTSAYLGPDVHHDAWCCGDLPGGKVLDDHRQISIGKKETRQNLHRSSLELMVMKGLVPRWKKGEVCGE